MPTDQATHYAVAEASKAFFIDMLTRDITLEDCILDLLDNSVDGARKKSGAIVGGKKFGGTKAEIQFNDVFFEIKDNGSGISLTEAEKYAFRFGNEELGKRTHKGEIGAYGIGMKRAIFKLGNHVLLTTSTGKESFTLDLHVDRWKRDKAPVWRFPLTNVIQGTKIPQGTTIRVRELHPEIVERLKNPRFENGLRRMIQRDYGYILAQGFEASLNSKPLKGEIPEFRDGEDVSPGVFNEVVRKISIRIKAGLADVPPDDTSPKVRNAKEDRWGWYVVCNDRVVVAGDKTGLTGWGVDEVPSWHPQYNGFLGLVEFTGPSAELPWLTTKRNIDPMHPAFVRALVKMKEFAERYTEYTNKRKKAVSAAKAKERASNKVPVTSFSHDRNMAFPQVDDENMQRIEYSKPSRDVKALGAALGLVSPSANEVGIRAFEYAFEREVK